MAGLEFGPQETDFSYTPPEAIKVSNIIKAKKGGQTYVGHTDSLASTELDTLQQAQGELYWTPPGLDDALAEYRAGYSFSERNRHYIEADFSDAERSLREWHDDLPPDVDILFYGGGSDEALQDVFARSLSSRETTRLILPDATFPGPVNYALSRNDIDDPNNNVSPIPLDTPLNQHPNVSLKEILKRQEARKSASRPNLYYLSVPTTPTGAEYSHGLLNQFMRNVDAQGHTAFFDTAFEAVIPREESVARFLKGGSTNAVLSGSISKADGLAGVGIAWLMMHRTQSEKFRTLLRPYRIRNQELAFIASYVLDVQKRKAHLGFVQQKVREIKPKLMKAFDDANIHYLPTSPRTPIMMVDGLSDEFHGITKSDLALETAPGGYFFNTHNGISNRFGRVTMPDSEDKIPLIVGRVEEAIRASWFPMPPDIL